MVTVDKVWVAHDCGKALNRLTVEGQVQGSVWMGMGQAMSEETGYHDGLMVTGNMLDYRVPTIQDSPPIEVGIVESNDPHGPFGAKEAGEGSLAAFLPALTNAIADAIGVRFNDLPVTPDRVFAAIEKQRAQRKGQRRTADGRAAEFRRWSTRRPLDEVLKARAAHPRQPAARRRHRSRGQHPARHRRAAGADRRHARRRAARASRPMRTRIEVGASVTLAELAEHPDVLRHYPVVAQAAALDRRADPSQHGHGRRQSLPRHPLHLSTIRANGGAARSITASRPPATSAMSRRRAAASASRPSRGDLAPALLTLGAEVDLAGPDGRRTLPLDKLYIGFARQDQPVTETLGDGKYYPVAAAGRVRHRGAREEHAGPALRLRQDPHPPLDRISGLRRRGGAAARRRHARRPARRLHRHQSAAGAARGHRRALRRRARRARVQGARRSRARPDHGDEDHVHARPLPPPRRRRAGAAAGAAIVGTARPELRLLPNRKREPTP